MVQTEESGRAGNNFGHRMGEYAAKHLGIELIRDSSVISNEAYLDGQRVVIKSAHKKTTSIGIPHNVLDRVDNVIAVLEDNVDNIEKGVHKYSLYKVDSEWFKSEMTPDSKRDYVGHLNRGKIQKHCDKISELTCEF
jgi:hypothetical protein